MAGTLALVWDLIAKDNASAAFARVGASAGVAAKETSGLGSAFAKAGGIIALAGIAVAAVSVKMAADFQESTTRLVTGAGESEKSIGMVRKGILDMAGAVGTMPEALSKGMYLIESAGYRGAKGLDVLKAAAEGAKVGGAEMSVVADGLTTAMTDYNIPTSQAALVTSKLIATVAAGKTNMSDLSASLSGILPFASSLGVKFNDITGAMATMTGEGIDAANASTMLRFTMMSLANETPKGKKALESIGMTAQQLKDDLSSKGVGGALAVVTEQIAKHFPAGSVKATQALAAIAGGTRGMGAALALTGTHAATLIANTKSIASAAAEAGGHVKGWALTEETLAAKLDSAKAGMAAMGINIGTVLIPYVLKAIEAGKVMTGWLIQHSTVSKILAGIIGGVMVVALAAWVVSLYSTAAGLFAVGGALAFVTWPIVAVVAAIAALVAGLIYAYNHFETFRNVVMTVVGAFKSAWTAVKDFISGFTKGTDAIGSAQSKFAVFGAVLYEKFAGAWNAIKSAISSVVGWFTGTAIPAISAVWNSVSSTAKAAADWYMKFVQPVFVAFGQFMVALFARIGTIVSWLWTTAFQPVFQLITLGWKLLWSLFKAVWEAVGPVLVANIKGAWTVLSALLVGTWNNMKAVFSAVWNGMKIVVETVLGVIRSVINVGTAVLKGDWSGAWNAVKAIFVTIWDGIKRAAQLAIDTLVQIMSNVKNTIVNVFSGAGSWLVNAGHAIIDGLLSGIKAAFGAVKSFVGGIASTIAGLKGPLEYDRQLLVPHGGAIMDGLNEGLTTGFGKVQGNVGSMAGRLSIGSLDFATSAVRSNAVTGVSGGGKMQTIILQVDGRELSRVVVNNNNNDLRRNGVSRL